MISKSVPSPTRAPDPRPARTRASIISAIESLGNQHKDLSVSLVVAEAGLSRSSFYSQFNDIGNVAVQLIRELYESPEAEATASSADVPDLQSATQTLLQEFNRRRFLYSAVLGSSAAVSAEWEVCEIIAAAWLPTIAAHAPAQVQPQFAARYIASGQLACIVAWLRSESPAELAEVESQLLELLPRWATPVAA